jgi:DNA replication protein DnaC
VSTLETLEAGLKRPRLWRVREILESETGRGLARFKDPISLVAYLVSEEVAARDATQNDIRLRAARFPGRKTLDQSDFAAQPAVNEAACGCWLTWTSSGRPRTWSAWDPAV